MADNQKAPEYLVYNNSGIRPVRVTFNLDNETLEREIMTIASSEISGIRTITYDLDPKTGKVSWWLWFDAASEHFVDRQTENTALRRAIGRYSKEFQDFAQKFGWNEADDDPTRGSTKVPLKQIVVDNKNQDYSGRVKGLRIAINPFLVAIFDVMGTAYNKQYGIRPPKMRLNRKWITDKKGNRLIGIEVEKYLANSFRDRSKPSATVNGKF